jgi:hypothetical protein
MMIEHMERGKEWYVICLIRFSKYSYFCWEELGQTTKNCTHDKLNTTEKSDRTGRLSNYKETGISLDIMSFVIFYYCIS